MIDESIRETIRQKRKEGKSLREIAAEVNHSFGLVQKICKEINS